MEVKVAEAMSNRATALASCRVTMALVPSAETATYSGSKSTEGALSTPGLASKMRTPAAFSAAALASNEVKPTTVATGVLMLDTSMMLTEPGAGSSPRGSISPSSAVSTLVPSGVKVRLSGSTPTCTLLMNEPSAALRKTTWPGRSLVVLGMATATLPLKTSTLVTSLLLRPIAGVLKSTMLSNCGEAGLLASTIWRPKLDVTNIRLLAAS